MTHDSRNHHGQTLLDQNFFLFATDPLALFIGFQRHEYMSNQLMAASSSLPHWKELDSDKLGWGPRLPSPWEMRFIRNVLFSFTGCNSLDGTSFKFKSPCWKVQVFVYPQCCTSVKKPRPTQQKMTNCSCVVDKGASNIIGNLDWVMFKLGLWLRHH